MSDTSPMHGRQLVASFTQDEIAVRVFHITQGCEDPKCEQCKQLADGDSYAVFAKPTPDEDEWCVALWSNGHPLEQVLELWMSEYGRDLDKQKGSLEKLAAIVGATWSEVVAKTQEITFCQVVFSQRCEQTGLDKMLEVSTLPELRAVRRVADPHAKGAMAAPLIARALGWDFREPDDA